MALEQRPDRCDRGRLALNNRMRITDGDRHELDPIDFLGRTYLDRSELLLDQVADDPGLRDPVADTDPHLVRAFALGQPPRGDPRAVSRQLRPRPVRVPDRDFGFGAEDVENLEHAVGLVGGGKLARPVRHQPLLLDEQVDVAVC